MIAIIDYGMGNLRSVQKALQFVGQDAVITSYLDEINKADKIVLPGVGAIGDAMETIRKKGFDKAIYKACDEGKPFLGICLGLQILFESSEESLGVSGLSLLKGKVLRIPAAPGLKIPHIGWNSLEIKKDGGLFRSITGEPYVYFVHSYYLKAEEDVVTAAAQYGVEIHAAVQKDNLMACQFHPEKSGVLGLKLLENFAAMTQEKGGV